MKLLKRFSYSQVDLRGDILALPKPAVSSALDKASFSTPQVEEVERKAAILLGREDCVWIPYESAKYTLGLLALSPGKSRLIVGDKSYFATKQKVKFYSAGDLLPEAVPNKPDGSLSIKAIINQLKITKDMFNNPLPTITTVVVENSHRVCSGRVLSEEFISRLQTFKSKTPNSRLYLDGSRLLDAYVALKRTSGISLTDMIKPFDAVTVFLAKPHSWRTGAIFAADPATLKEARIYREYMMNQSEPESVPGSAEAYLESFEEWLNEDQAKADFLASMLKELGYTVDPYDTNILDISLDPIDTQVLSDALRTKGILANPLYEDPSKLRVVTHGDITVEGLKEATEVFGVVSKELLSRQKLA